MTFRKGKSGNPQGGHGNRKIVSDYIVKELLVLTGEGEITKARALARSLVDRAISGDSRAADIVLERTEGKSEQTINVRRSIKEFTDAELEAIASGTRDIEPESGAEVANQVH